MRLSEISWLGLQFLGDPILTVAVLKNVPGLSGFILTLNLSLGVNGMIWNKISLLSS